jgi:hypothetical protein
MLLLLNSAYLAGSAEPSLFYFLNVTAHAVGGAVLGAAGTWWLGVAGGRSRR